jgi:hypothetical protein
MKLSLRGYRASALERRRQNDSVRWTSEIQFPRQKGAPVVHRCVPIGAEGGLVTAVSEAPRTPSEAIPMTTWLDTRVAEIRERLTRGDEASLWTLFFADPDGEPVVASAVDNAMNEIDIELVRRLAQIADGVSATACLFVVIRRDGRPRPEDRQLWRDLRVLLRGSSTRLLGFAVVGTSSYWAPECDDDLGSVA